MCIEQIAGIAQRGETDATRLAACIHLLDRGWGRCEQTHTGSIDGELNINIRNILIDITPSSRARTGSASC